MKSNRRWWWAALAGGSLLLGGVRGGVLRAEDRAPGWADLAKLEAELRDQRQLILQLMQNEQQRYDMLMKLINLSGGAPAAAAPPAPGLTPARAVVAASSEPAKREPREAPAPQPQHAAVSYGAIEGSVRVAGGEPAPAYVFVKNVASPPARGRTVEIKQENKQFVPALTVVQAGTTLTFPNLDGIFHNVFSNSPKNAFDLGTYRTGDPTRTAVMNEPGVVDVQCNMHEQMRATVLVVPNKLYAAVRPNGTFRIDGVPVGKRRIVAWGPNLKPVQQVIDVGPAGARADFALSPSAARALPNKLGQAYGSYNE